MYLLWAFSRQDLSASRAFAFLSLMPLQCIDSVAHINFARLLKGTLHRQEPAFAAGTDTVALIILLRDAEIRVNDLLVAKMTFGLQKVAVDRLVVVQQAILVSPGMFPFGRSTALGFFRKKFLSK